ncbi:MAG: phosphoribosylglycinamide formyltransferase [Gemmatimonadaceae bacterium]
MTARIAVLASGTGTNLQAIIDYNATLGSLASGAVVLVGSNRKSAGALDRARAEGIPAELFDASDDGTALRALLKGYSIDLVVLAGYLKHLPPMVIAAYHARMVNIHPGLIPEFGGAGMYGDRVHTAVIASGTKYTGVSVHFVDDEFDHGPLIAQWRIPVHPGDTPEALAARVLEVEHKVYPPIVDMVASLNASDSFADY